MLARHFLRAKVLQVFYATRSNNADIIWGNRLFTEQVNDLNELAIWQAAVLLRMPTVAKQVLDDAKTKFNPTEVDLNASYSFVNNKFLAQLSQNADLQKQIGGHRVDWTEHSEMLRELFLTFRASSIYADYVSLEEPSFDDDKEIALQFFKLAMNNEVLREPFGLRSLLWEDDFDQIAQLVFSTLRGFDSSLDKDTPFPLMLDMRNESDTEAWSFASKLLADSMSLYDENVEIIKAHLNGWEFDRVAELDVLLLVMAIAELTQCESIPERVTINEYIELSKEFSTPRSKLFINGILDRILSELRAAGKVQKSGRGLYVPDDLFFNTDSDNEK